MRRAVRIGEGKQRMALSTDGLCLQTLLSLSFSLPFSLSLSLFPSLISLRPNRLERRVSELLQYDFVRVRAHTPFRSPFILRVYVSRDDITSR